MDKPTIHHRNRSQKSNILEIPTKANRTNSVMAQKTARLQLQNHTCPRKNQYAGRCIITTKRSRHHRGQPRTSPHPRISIPKHLRRRLRWIVRTTHYKRPTPPQGSPGTMDRTTTNPNDPRTRTLRMENHCHRQTCDSTRRGNSKRNRTRLARPKRTPGKRRNRTKNPTALLLAKNPTMARTIR